MLKYIYETYQISSQNYREVQDLITLFHFFCPILLRCLNTKFFCMAGFFAQLLCKVLHINIPAKKNVWNDLFLTTKIHLFYPFEWHLKLLFSTVFWVVYCVLILSSCPHPCICHSWVVYWHFYVLCYIYLYKIILLQLLDMLLQFCQTFPSRSYLKDLFLVLTLNKLF